MSDIVFRTSPVHTIGSLPIVGTQAPDFTVTKTDLGEIHLKDYRGRKIILNIFPSLDTPVCAKIMRRFNQIANQVKDTLILCISADLPFAQKRFCSAEHLSNVHAVSIFRHPQFGKDYGVTMTDGPFKGLLSRAIVVLDEHGKVLYTEQVADIEKEPNYHAILNALQI